MALQRVTLKLQVTTDPVSASSAIPHSGSWSEGHWDNVGLAINSPLLYAVAIKRGLMLPKQAAIVGIKLQQYTISAAKDRLIPGGTRTLSVRFAGNPLYNVNIPQDAMGFAAAMNGTPSAVRFKAKCIPDEVVSQGEFNGDAAFKTTMTNYGTALKDAQLGSVVRDLTLPSARVVSLVGGVITPDFNPFFFASGFYAILRGVKDDITGKPISGSFLCTSSAAGAFTFQGLPTGAVAHNSGFIRADEIKFASYASIGYTRVGEGKIGAPFEKYRGRRSKRRA